MPPLPYVDVAFAVSEVHTDLTQFSYDAPGRMHSHTHSHNLVVVLTVVLMSLLALFAHMFMTVLKGDWGGVGSNIAFLTIVLRSFLQCVALWGCIL